MLVSVPMEKTMFGLMDCNQFMFLDAEYALLHPKYFDSFSSKIELRDFKKIFVSFGGANDHSAITFLLNSLHNHSNDIHCKIVSIKSNQSNDKIKKMFISRWRDKAKFHIKPENTDDAMINCDFCIIGGGTMSFEAKQGERAVGIWISIPVIFRLK